MPTGVPPLAAAPPPDELLTEIVDQILVPLIQPMRLPAGTPGQIRRAPRRIARHSISKMRSGKRRPCCFNLAAGTDPDLPKNGKLINPP